MRSSNDAARGSTGSGEFGLEALWSSVHRLVAQLVSAADRDTFLDDCLDQLVEIVGAHKGLIALTDRGGAGYTVNARGSGRALSDYEREEISRTIIRQVHQTGQLVCWVPDVGGTTPSAVAFGITCAIAAPIRAMALGQGAGGVRGVVYLDFRDVRARVTPFHQQFVDIAASLIAVVLQQSEELRLTREDLRSALVAHPGGAPVPDLEEILRPPAMDPIRAELASALRSDQPILITGESGTGKTLLARAIADASGRTPFVRATLGQSDDLNTIASELFGHLAGAFSGALTARKGLVEFASGGVLLLDEILNLPRAAQQLLLDFTQFGTYRPLGYSGAEPRHSRVRLIAATNGSLEQAVRDNRFREDLYFRLSGIKLELPPLRARRQDIPGLAESHLRRRDPGRAWTLSPGTRRLLLSSELRWPGNVRQLEAAVQRACERALARDPDVTAIDPEHFGARDLAVAELPDSVARPPSAASTPTPAGDPILGDGDPSDFAGNWRRMNELRDALQERERELFTALLARYNGVVARAARELGISRTSLVSRLSTYRIPHGRGDE